MYCDEINMHESREFCQRGSNFDNFFFKLMRGGRIQVPLKAGHHCTASETPLNGVLQACWCWPNIECWLGTCDFSGNSDLYWYKPYIFVIFQRGGGSGPPAPPPSGSSLAKIKILRENWVPLEDPLPERYLNHKCVADLLSRDQQPSHGMSDASRVELMLVSVDETPKVLEQRKPSWPTGLIGIQILVASLLLML